MKLVLVGLTGILALAACAEVTNETQGTYTYRGTTYPVVTRTFQTENGSYSRRSVRVKSQFVTCSATDDRDCDAEIFRARLSSDDR